MSLGLRATGLLSFLSGSPSEHGQTLRLLLALLRWGILLLGSLGLAWLAAWIAAAQLDRTVVTKDIKRIASTDFKALEAELGRAVSITPSSSGDHFGLAVTLGDRLEAGPPAPAAPPAVSADSCRPNRYTGDVCLLVINHPGGFASLIELKFPDTIYTIPEVVLELARQADGETYTAAKASKIRRLTEQALGEDLFTPSSSSVLSARRFNGTFQYVTYYFGFLALLLILFSAGGSIVVNAGFRRIRQVDIPVEEPPTPDVDSAEAHGQAVDHGMIVEVPPIPAAKTPWRGGTPSADAVAISKYIDRVSARLRDGSKVLGVRADPPVLRFRRAGARALVNTKDTSILPSFLDAQKASILAFYDARLALVRYLLWLIPTIGFIGTIVGVGDALSATLGLQSSLDVVAAASQGSVSSSMGLAFDTTLVALAVSVVAMLFYHIVQGAEDQMVTQERDDAEEELIKRARAIAKPGTTEDLAQQLVKMGVNADILSSDLKLFHDHGTNLQAAVSKLEQSAARVVDMHPEGRGRLANAAPWSLVGVLVIVVIFLVAGEKLPFGDWFSKVW